MLLHPYRFTRPNYAATVLADSPVAYYRMGDTGAVLADYSGNARNGTFNGTITQKGAPSLVSNSGGEGGMKVASAGYGLAANSAPLAFNRNFTIECWFSCTTFNGVGALISRGRGGYYLRCNGSATAGTLNLLQSQTGSAGTPAGTTALQPNTRYHAVVTVDAAGNCVGYLNGNVEFSGVVNVTFTAGLGNTGLGVDGYSAWNAETMSGTLDEVAFYNSVLSAARVQAHWNAGK